VIISVIGLGYIGLPTAAILASRGFNVIGVDVNQSTVDIINQGKIHIIEPDLDTLVNKVVKDNFLKSVTKPVEADIFIIAVPSPLKDNYQPDLSYIKSASKAIASVLARGNLVILESTSPVGTTEKMITWMREERPDLTFPNFGDDKFKGDVSVTFCPERVLPGHVLRELVENDRIIGGVSTRCALRARKLYEIFVKADFVMTDCRTAELCKLAENSFRDVNIAFANELSLICDNLDIDVWQLIKLANRHPRVNILQPGPGVGGHCIAVDPWFVVDSSPDEAKLIRMARLVNDSKPLFVLNKVNEVVQSTGRDISELSIACLGIAFKPNIDDLRESPALNIARKIGALGFKSIFLVEPNIDHLPSGFNIDNSELAGLERAINGAEIVILLVDHASFISMDLSLLSGKQVIDTRGIWSNK